MKSERKRRKMRHQKLFHKICAELFNPKRRLYPKRTLVKDKCLHCSETGATLVTVSLHDISRSLGRPPIETAADSVQLCPTHFYKFLGGYCELKRKGEAS